MNDKNIIDKSLKNFNDAFIFIKKIRGGNITLEKEKENQNEFKSDLNRIKRCRHKSNNQKRALYNIKKFNNGREKSYHFFDDFSSTISEAKYKRVDGEGLS